MNPQTFATTSPVGTLSHLDAEIARVAEESLVGVPERLKEAILYSFMGPGKRIRPRIVLSVAEAFNLPSEISFRLAAALELTHAYTLVHDDLPSMDNDDFRRGRPTNHKVFGEGMAVLAGDSLALLAPDVLLGVKLPSDRVLRILNVLLSSSGARGVIAGQASEMGLTKDPSSLRIENLIEIFRLKTGALFRAAMSLPAIAASADESTISLLGKIGDDLGIAFQIADDLEDDFTQKKSDPAHISYYVDLKSAHQLAIDRLRLPPNLSDQVRNQIEPFLSELRGKIERTSV
jgi:geranylgeranyl diphosphate synthase type II